MDLSTLFKISYGLYVVCSEYEDVMNGQIVNVVTQISAEPPTLATSINRTNYTHELIRKSRKFSIMILEKDTPLSHIGRFGFKSGRVMDKFEGLHVVKGKRGLPVIQEFTIGYIEVEVQHELDIETHTIFAGKIMHAELFNHKEPMTYAYYHDVKRGTTPSTAATYQAKKQKVSDTEILNNIPQEGKTMEQYRCLLCSYEYDPAIGDPDSGIEPGTPFEKIPEDWVCPICGAGKDQFEKI